MNDRHHPNNPDTDAPDIQAWIEADEDRMRSVNDIINLWDELCVAFDTEHEGWEFINIEQLKDYANAKRTYRNPARTGKESARYRAILGPEARAWAGLSPVRNPETCHD